MECFVYMKLYRDIQFGVWYDKSQKMITRFCCVLFSFGYVYGEVYQAFAWFTIIRQGCFAEVRANLFLY